MGRTCSMCAGKHECSRDLVQDLKEKTRGVRSGTREDNIKFDVKCRMM
jgi:positive regulator of sigma E activity